MSDERFWSKVNRSAADACWTWKGRVTEKNKYGRASVNGKKIPAHRVAFALANGAIPDGLYVLHRCDNPPCCNPAHLFLGTYKDNIDDMDAKGRRVNNPPLGSNHGCAKIDEWGACGIMARYLMGLPGGEVVDSTGLALRSARAIAHGQTWRWLFPR
jgi:hypothetical protein